MSMFSPAHPGELVKERLGSLSVSEAAEHLGVSRVTLSRLINCKAGVSAEMALRLGEAFGTTPESLAEAPDELRPMARFAQTTPEDTGPQDRGRMRRG